MNTCGWRGSSPFSRTADAGRDFLSDVRYDPFYTAFARNMLRSCRPEAILFTNGDTDTFPLEYVQMAEGFRTDVTVVNMSMFTLPSSISYYRSRTKVPIPFTLPDSVFARDLTDVAVLRKEPCASTPVVDFLTGVEKKRLNPDITWHAYLDLPSTGFTLPGPVGTDSMRWSVPKEYVLRNGIALFDLMHTNEWKRPVHFALTMGHDSYMGLQDHFALEGLAYRLTPVRGKEDSTFSGRVDPERCLVLFIDSLDSSGMEGRTKGKSMLATNYRIHMARVASQFGQDRQSNGWRTAVGPLYGQYSRNRSPLGEHGIRADGSLLPLWRVREGRSCSHQHHEVHVGHGPLDP